MKCAWHLRGLNLLLVRQAESKVLLMALGRWHYSQLVDAAPLPSYSLLGRIEKLLQLQDTACDIHLDVSVELRLVFPRN